ncbi:MAG TPA: DinB family protein [Thermoanaerobaculia bacterium]|nr:DinB family protein [Thermoanaerobaculia bacterium]
MPLSDAERRRLIDRYAEGPQRLRAAIGSVPEEARKWRPGEGKWSAHEVVCHCGDAEVNAAMRLRYLLCEPDPVIQAYDEAKWARDLRYHDFPLEPSLESVRAVRAHTADLLRRLPADAWGRTGRHSGMGVWDVDRWLTIYSEHVHKHAGQIERNLAAWREAGSPAS